MHFHEPPEKTLELKALSNQRIYANTELQGLQPIKPIATTKITKALPFSKIVHAAPVFVSATIKSEYRKEKWERGWRGRGEGEGVERVREDQAVLL